MPYESPGQQALARMRETQASYAAPLPPVAMPQTNKTGVVAPVAPTASRPPTVAPAPVSSGSRGNRTVGQATGLSDAEAWIIQHESGGRPDAWNNTVVYDNGRRLGNAWGIGQIVDDRPRSQRPQTVAEQLAVFRNYVAHRYGTAEKAQQFWQSHGWY